MNLFNYHVMKRRGNLITHLKLEYRFWKIGQDKYVKMTRKQLKEEQQ